METGRECLCCKEVPKIIDKMNQMDIPVKCITEHPGFEAVCLNVWVLQTAYFQYRQHYGSTTPPTTLHEYVKTGVVCGIVCFLTFPSLFLFCYRKYRYTAYRQLTRWCWGWLGKDIRIILPACAVKKIRESFPSETYTGFQYPILS